MKIGVIKHLQEKSFFEQIPLIKVKESFEDKDLPLEERTKKFRIITTKNSNTYTTAIWDEEKVSERGCSPLENPDYLFEAKNYYRPKTCKYHACKCY